MRVGRFLFVLCCVLALAATGWCASDSGAEPAWERVTVETTQQVYESVTLRWALGGYSLSLTADDGSTTGVSPSLVTAIRDAGGTDITQEVADACPATGITFALLGQDRTDPFLFRWMLGAGVTAGLVNGEGDFLTDGALHAGLRLRTCSWSHLHVLYRYQRVVEDMSGLRGIADTNADELHLLIGSRLTHPRRNDNYVYLEAGPALVNSGVRFVGDALVANNDWALAGTMRGGVVLPVTDRLGLDLGGIFMARPSVVAGSGDMTMTFGIDAALTARW